MNKEKQIKLEIFGVLQDCDKKYCDLYDCDECCAEKLYNAGYRKLPKDSVVLTREEYTNYMVEYMGVKEIKQRVTNETAEKIILSEMENIKYLRDACVLPEPKYIEGYVNCCNAILFYLKNNLAKQFNVEIKE